MAKAKQKKKKVSIREFVSEDSLKFQLYYLKLANQLKRIDDMETDAIIEKWEYDTNKKINRFTNDKSKPQFKTQTAQDAIDFNINYVRNLPVPIDKDEIHKVFELKRKEYIDALNLRINDNSTATLKQDLDLLEYAKEVKLDSVVSKEKFGQMLLLMIKNLATMPSFSGYSDNWKTDFFSNAIEKTLLYLDNFDEKLQSKRTGDNSKAFAYVTQICFNAFVNIINIRKKENDFLKDTISLETANLEGAKSYITKVYEEPEEKIIKHEYTVSIKKIQDLDETIAKAMDYINLSNEILDINKANQLEIEYLNENTPQEEKNNDYDEYIKDLELKIVPALLDFKIETLRIIKPNNISLGDYVIPRDITGNISVIIAEKVKKVKKSKKPEPELIEIDDTEQVELENFTNEW